MGGVHPTFRVWPTKTPNTLNSTNDRLIREAAHASLKPP